MYGKDHHNIVKKFSNLKKKKKGKRKKKPKCLDGRGGSWPENRERVFQPEEVAYAEAGKQKEGERQREREREYE